MLSAPNEATRSTSIRPLLHQFPAYAVPISNTRTTFSPHKYIPILHPQSLTHALYPPAASHTMGWFGPDKQELPVESWKECTTWMIVNDGGAAWRNSASFEDRADGDGPACGEELIEGPHGELCTLLPHALPMNGCRVCSRFVVTH